MNLKERARELDECVVYRYGNVSSGCANSSPKPACVIYMHNWGGRGLRYETAVAPLAQPVDYSAILSHSSPLISSRNNAPTGARDWLVFVASGCYPYPLIIPVAVRPVRSLLHPRRVDALTVCIVVYFFLWTEIHDNWLLD